MIAWVSPADHYGGVMNYPNEVTMARIMNPQIGQMFWTVTNGNICQRIYAGRSPLYNGHILEVPGMKRGANSYYETYVFAYEFKSDILALHLESARNAAEEAAAKVPWLELEWRNALKAERDAQYAAEVQVA